MEEKRFLILNGSPRKKGTSYSFGHTIKKLIEEEGSTAEIIHIIDYLDENKNIHDLKNIILQSDIISFISPLYVDTLPYPAIWFFEKLTVEFIHELQGKRFFAIAQCGFPNIALCEPLLESCMYFAEETGIKWMGGLAYGGGAIINGELLENLGRKGKKITTAFKLALKDVLYGEIISSEPQKLLTVKIPKFLYPLLVAFLNYNSRKTARKYGVTDLSKRTYLE